MLFRKDIPKDCAYCVHSSRREDGAIRCGKNGPAEAEGCWRFSYDPMKRVPKKAKTPDFSRYDEDDFSL